MRKETVMSGFQKLGKKERAAPKFLKQGTEISVIIEQAPKETTVTGRWGPRKMFIVGTKEYGDIYVSSQSFCRISEGIGDLTTGLYKTES